MRTVLINKKMKWFLAWSVIFTQLLVGIDNVLSVLSFQVTVFCYEKEMPYPKAAISKDQELPYPKIFVIRLKDC